MHNFLPDYPQDFDGDVLIGNYKFHKPSKVKKGRRKHYPNQKILFESRIITYRFEPILNITRKVVGASHVRTYFEY